MELRQIRYFVAVAEEQSFSRAAERLHISQPPLSQQIKSLEDELNVQLFRRLPRGVTLTAAGEVLLKSCLTILAQVRMAAQETSQAAAGMKGTIRMGTVSSALIYILPQILRHLSDNMPDIKIEFVEMSSREQTQAVLRDDLDIGLVHTPIDTTGLLTHQVFREEFCAVLPPGHRLASHDTIPLESLANDEFVFFPRTLASGLFDKMVSLCMKAGFSPQIHHTARHQATILRMVTMGLGVTVVPGSLQQIYRGDATFCRLSGAPEYVEMCVVWRAGEPSVLTQSVVASLQSRFRPA